MTMDSAQISDRELLELAAKAAGLEPLCWDNERQAMKLPNCYLDNRNSQEMLPKQKSRWNPLTDDGDALRLAVKLGLRINVFLARMEPFTSVVYATDRCVEEEHRDDAGRATRRAIVRAAAAIGAKP